MILKLSEHLQHLRHAQPHDHLQVSLVAAVGRQDDEPQTAAPAILGPGRGADQGQRRAVRIRRRPDLPARRTGLEQRARNRRRRRRRRPMRHDRRRRWRHPGPWWMNRATHGQPTVRSGTPAPAGATAGEEGGGRRPAQEPARDQRDRCLRCYRLRLNSPRPRLAMTASCSFNCASVLQSIAVVALMQRQS